MAHTPPLARRLRLGIIGDGAGAIDADQLGVTLIAGVTAPWPSTHPAVIGVAAQVDADAGLQWLGGDACSVLHGGTGDPAVAVGDVANVLLSGIATGLVRHDLLTHLQQHCGSTAQRRAG